MVPVEVAIPDWPYDSLDLILFAEAAAAFEELTLSGELEPAQDAGARRVAQHLPPVALSLRRGLCAVRSLPPQSSRRNGPHLFPGRPAPRAFAARRNADHYQLHRSSLAYVPSAGFVEVSEARSDWAPDPAHPLPKFSPPRRVPHGVTLIGRLFDEGTVGKLASRWSASSTWPASGRRDFDDRRTGSVA